MSNKYFDGVIENPGVEEPVDQELKDVAAATVTNMEAKMEAFQVGAALDEIFTLLRRSNKYIDETEPWKLAKDPEKADRLKTVLYNLLESLRIAGVLLESFMPETSKKMLDALNTNERSLDSARTFGLLEQGGHVAKSVEPLFKRIDPKEFAKDAKVNEEKADQKAAKAKKKAEKKKKKEPAAPIEIDDFAKVTLQAGKIIDAKVHPDADKLLVETVDLGEAAPRQIVSGIAKAYKPEDLIGKMVMVVSNLKPAQLRGVESQGMLLCTTGKEGPRVVFLDDSVVPGTTIR